MTMCRSSRALTNGTSYVCLYCRFNLKVKVLSRDTEEFPGGFTYHKRFTFMKDLFEGRAHPFIFHMSWTQNKKNKLNFFKQMGNCKIVAYQPCSTDRD